MKWLYILLLVFSLASFFTRCSLPRFPKSSASSATWTPYALFCQLKSPLPSDIWRVHGYQRKTSYRLQVTAPTIPKTIVEIVSRLTASLLTADPSGNVFHQGSCSCLDGEGYI